LPKSRFDVSGIPKTWKYHGEKQARGFVEQSVFICAAVYDWTSCWSSEWLRKTAEEKGLPYQSLVNQILAEEMKKAS
jgi:hypothetical protein